MPRFCTRCGSPLTEDREGPDGEKIEGGHDRGEPIPYEDPITGHVRKRRPWLCRVRKVAHHFATDLRTGERTVSATYVPDSMQRTRKNDARYVPIRLLKLRADG